MRVVVMFGLAALLAGCGSSSSFPAGGEVVPAGVVDDGMVLGELEIGGRAVPGAPVELRVGDQVVATATSDELGNFFFDHSLGEQPANVFATVDGARYSAMIPPGDRYAWVTELSTLLHDYVEDHPGASYSQANEAVGAAIGCPPGEDVTRLSDRDIFDPATFHQLAEAHPAGEAAFLEEIQASLDTEDLDFSAPDPYEDLGDEIQDPHHRVPRAGRMQVQYGGPAFFTENMNELAAAGLIALSAKGWGWFLGRVGGNTGPSLSDIAAQLSRVSQAVETLDLELARQYSQFQLNEAFGAVSATSATLREYALLLAGNSRNTAATNLPQRPPAFIQTYLRATQYNAGNARNYADTLLDSMLGRRTGEGVVPSFNRAFQVSHGRLTPLASLGNYDMRSNAMTRQLQDNLNFAMANLDLAADMLSNAVHADWLRPQILIPYQPNSLPRDIRAARQFLASSPSQTPGGNNDVAALRQRARQLVPPTLPSDDIMVLPPDFPAVVPGTPTLLYLRPFEMQQEGARANVAYGSFQNNFLRGRVPEPWANPRSAAETDRWILPTLAQYRELDRIATQAGNGDPHRGLVRLGFREFDDVDTLPGFTFQGARTTTLARDDQGRVRAARIEVYIFGQGQVYNAPINPTSRPYLGAVFLRGALSLGNKAQGDVLPALGTTVRPTIAVRPTGSSRLLAMATYTMPTGQVFEVDVTERVEWLSSAPNRLEVSNLLDSTRPPGTLTHLQTGAPVTVSASLLVDASSTDSPGSYAVGTTEVTPNGRLLYRDIMITPRNTIFTAARNPAATFYCTGHLGPGTVNHPPTEVDDLTNTVRWSLIGPDGVAVDANRAQISNGSGGLGGILRLEDPTLPNGLYTIRAELTAPNISNGRSSLLDETRIRLQLQ